MKLSTTPRMLRARLDERVTQFLRGLFVGLLAGFLLGVVYALSQLP